MHVHRETGDKVMIVRQFAYDTTFMPEGGDIDNDDDHVTVTDYEFNRDYQDETLVVADGDKAAARVKHHRKALTVR